MTEINIVDECDFAGCRNFKTPGSDLCKGHSRVETTTPTPESLSDPDAYRVKMDPRIAERDSRQEAPDNPLPLIPGENLPGLAVSGGKITQEVIDRVEKAVRDAPILPLTEARSVCKFCKGPGEKGCPLIHHKDRGFYHEYCDSEPEDGPTVAPDVIEVKYTSENLSVSESDGRAMRSRFGLADSGKTQEFDTGAHRDAEEGKGDFSLLPFEGLQRIAVIFQKGGPEKYGRNNWKMGMPRVGESPAPWEYRGWLLFYAQEIQRTHPAIPDRWGYLADTIAQKRFASTPIPKIEFVSSPPAIGSHIEECVRVLDRHGFWRSFRLLIGWISFGLGIAKKSPREISPEESEQLYRTLNIGPMMLEPSDHFGSWLAQTRGKGWNPNAFYPTPHPVCEAMVLMTMNYVEATARKKGVDVRALSVSDPCCGTGRMLLHASNYSMNLYAQDIDEFVLEILKVNAALYAPWLLLPPREVIGESTHGLRIVCTGENLQLFESD